MSGAGKSPWRGRRAATAALAPEGACFRLLLDGAAARTPAGAPFLLPNAALGAALAAEWNEAVGSRRAGATPLMQIALTAIDRASDRPLWADEILAFAGTDLLCHRAGGPPALVRRQDEVWSPFLRWAREALGAELKTVCGVVAVAQPGPALAALRRRLDGFDSWRLAGTRRAAELTGSAVLALALEAGAFPADEIFAASRLDERFQAEKWGADAEAEARERRIEADFGVAARYLVLLGTKAE